MSEAAAAPHLTVHRLEKRFGPVQALRGVSLSVPPGERLLLTGPNGSGKSTFLRIVAGLIRPSRGQLRFRNNPVRALPPAHSGYLGHGLQLFGALTVRENLALFATLRGFTGSFEELLARWQLQDFAERRLKSLSRGLQARVGLARACLGAPEILLLDEPSANLDLQSVQTLQRFLSEPLPDGRRQTVLVASHDLGHFESWADRVVVLERGQLAGERSRHGEGAQ